MLSYLYQADDGSTRVCGLVEVRERREDSEEGALRRGHFLLVHAPCDDDATHNDAG